MIYQVAGVVRIISGPDVTSGVMADGPVEDMVVERRRCLTCIDYVVVVGRRMLSCSNNVGRMSREKGLVDDQVCGADYTRY